MSDSPNSALLDRKRKRKALLAGGVVLGLGGTVTLAAWTDDVWVNSTISSGKFNVQAAVDVNGTTWAEHNATPGGALTFTVAATAAAMTPGDSVYAPINFRVDPGANSYDAEIRLSSAPSGAAVSSTANDALFSNLTVAIYKLAPASCTATGTGAATPVVTGPLSTTYTASPFFTLSKTASPDTTPQALCFKITLNAGAPAAVKGGTTSQLVWKFDAKSV
ncbi:SipW-dependent-type signal peptide-containing protein [Dietzia maris]